MTRIGLFHQLEPQADEDAALFFGLDDDGAWLAVYKIAPQESDERAPDVMVKLTKKQQYAVAKLLELPVDGLCEDDDK